MTLNEIGVPENKIEILQRKKITSVEKLLYTMPKDYIDFSEIYPLKLDGKLNAIIKSKIPVAIIGICKVVNSSYSNGTSLIKIKVEDKITTNILHVNIIGEYKKLELYKAYRYKEVIVGGILQYSSEYGSFSMLNPIIFSTWIKKNNAIIPFYSKYSGISEEYYEKTLTKCIEAKKGWEYVPQHALDKYRLPSFSDTIQLIHHPKTMQDIQKGIQRIVFDDMLYFACKLEKQGRQVENNSLFIIHKTECMETLIKRQPFTLTNGQSKSIYQMIELAKQGKRFSGLVQGDVGSGKTLVAFALMIAMAENGYQSVLMAPTAVLARQHYEKLVEEVKEFGFKVVLLTSELKLKEKKEVLKSIKNQEAIMVVGTHSCISKDVDYGNLGLTITDEEHKFGVIQRETLIQKAQEGVHNIIMSGTPIPRTLANTIYGNNTAVYSLELPANRQPIQTAICHSNKPVFEWMLKEIKKGHQCYVVCPFISKSEKDNIKKVPAVDEITEIYENAFTPYGIKIAALNGDTKKEKQSKILKEFAENKTQILIATTVIEVGVNVPNATVMVITGAERFGLATLHQLRGRVGRGSDKSYCILQTSPGIKENVNLNVLCEETDGLKIATADLTHRGTGNILGTEQSGFNKYIDLMLLYPNMFEKVKKLAQKLCDENSCTDFIEVYEKINGIDS